MSLPGGGSLRLRLFFDYPPPNTPESCQCWLLLDLSRCRLVTDLSSLIRARFGFSQRARLSLFLQECLLPPCEAIGVVRDNDCIRVKLEEVVTYENFESGDNDIRSPRKASKRAAKEWEKEEDLHQKKKNKIHDFETSPSKNLHFECRELKKKSKKRKSIPEGTLDSCSEENSADVNQKKMQIKKKFRSKAMELENKSTDVKNITKVKEKKILEDSVSAEKVNASKKTKLQIVRTDRTASESDSESDSTSTSSLSIKGSSKLKQFSNKSPAFVKNKAVSQPVTATTGTATKDPMASKLGPSVKPVIDTTGKPSPSSTDCDINKAGAGSTLDKKNTQMDNHFTDAGLKLQQEKVSTNSESSDSSDSDNFVIKKPAPGPSLAGNGDAQNSVLHGPDPNPRGGGRGMARGCGRGQDTVLWRGLRGHGFRGRARGRGRGNANHFPYDYSTENVEQQFNHSVTNRSIIIQNPPQTPKKDYSAMPLLAAAPPVGQKIAFKLLELTENYSPGVSEYKEGKIINYSPVTQELDLEVPSASGAPKVPGKFDLVYESEGGERTIEYAMPQDTKITQRWASLIEPRLIVETLPVSKVATNQANGDHVLLSQ